MNERVVAEIREHEVELWYEHHPEHRWTVSRIQRPDGVVFYDAALTRDEIAAIYKAEAGEQGYLSRCECGTESLDPKAHKRTCPSVRDLGGAGEQGDG